MKMQYKSKPHEIRAFQFTDCNLKPPSWFVDAVHAGKASVTLHFDKPYITLYNNKTDMERAYIGQWICMNNKDKLYRISDDEFREAYIVEE